MITIMNGYPTIIPITNLRRKFGEITENLVKTDAIILTKAGRPFAILKSAPEEKRRKLMATAGSLKGTEFDDPKFVASILTRKSRKSPIII